MPGSPHNDLMAFDRTAVAWDTREDGLGAVAPPETYLRSLTGCNEFGGEDFRSKGWATDWERRHSFPRLCARQRKFATEAQGTADCATAATGGFEFMLEGEFAVTSCTISRWQVLAALGHLP